MRDHASAVSSDESAHRRRFLLGLGWTSLLVSVIGPSLANIRFLFPNVVYEGGDVFKLDSPDKYPVGSITFLAAQKVFLFREKGGFRACTAICTHLRCVTGPFVGAPGAPPEVLRSRCPCHGSVFDGYGRVLAGPAPRPLDFYRVAKSPDGRVVVDAREVVSPHETFQA
ncbi:MAG: Rieske (2Fe-2S) protein [Candidatus Tectomicrobia bacterium]|nr:Rieske (2Fe-2S) protein [Candidatus Tectomicrobia bacterium]